MAWKLCKQVVTFHQTPTCWLGLQACLAMLTLNPKAQQQRRRRQSVWSLLCGTCFPAPAEALLSSAKTGLVQRNNSGALSPKVLARQASDASGADYAAKLEDQVDLLMEEVSSLLDKVGYENLVKAWTRFRSGDLLRMLQRQADLRMEAAPTCCTRWENTSEASVACGNAPVAFCAACGAVRSPGGPASWRRSPACQT